MRAENDRTAAAHNGHTLTLLVIFNSDCIIREGVETAAKALKSRRSRFRSTGVTLTPIPKIDADSERGDRDAPRPHANSL